MFMAIFVQLGVLSVGFYFYPTAAIIVAIIVSNAIGIWVTVHYSVETYRLVGLWPRLRASRGPFGGCCPRSRRGLASDNAVGTRAAPGRGTRSCTRRHLRDEHPVL